MTATNGHNNHIQSFSPTIKSVVNNVDSQNASEQTKDSQQSTDNIKASDSENKQKLSASEIFSFINSQVKDQRKKLIDDEALAQFLPKKDNAREWGAQTEDVAERTSASSTPESVAKEAEIATQTFTEETNDNVTQTENRAKIQKEINDKIEQDIADATSDSDEVDNEKVNSIWRAIFG
jgi:hypothetical protein